ALALKPDDWQSLFNRGTILLQLKDPQGALADLDKCVKLEPRRPGGWAYRANAKAALGDYADAVKDLTRALDLHDPEKPWTPADGYTFDGRGKFRRQAGDLKGSLEDHDRAIELEPRVAHFWGNRGLTKDALGDPAGAIQDFSK